MNMNQKHYKKINRAALRLLHTEGFIERYQEILQETDDLSFKEAYELTETEHVEAFEFRRYSNHYSFKKSYQQYTKRKKRNVRKF